MLDQLVHPQPGPARSSIARKLGDLFAANAFYVHVDERDDPRVILVGSIHDDGDAQLLALVSGLLGLSLMTPATRVLCENGWPKGMMTLLASRGIYLMPSDRFDLSARRAACADRLTALRRSATESPALQEAIRDFVAALDESDQHFASQVTSALQTHERVYLLTGAFHVLSGRIREHLEPTPCLAICQRLPNADETSRGANRVGRDQAD